MMKIVVVFILSLCIFTSTAYQGLKHLNRIPLLRSTERTLRRSSQLYVSEVLANTEAFTNAFVGGTIGVMSVAFIVEVRKSLNEQTHEGCPYCLGNGEMLCAACCGCKVSMSGSGGSGAACSVCQGRGIVMCINCKGDGRITPMILQPKATRDPEFATDSIHYDSP